MTELFVHGDQFVGMNVNPNDGNLVLRFWFIVGDKADANGRGVTNYAIQESKDANIGRPLIYAPDKSQGGTKGHTSFLTTNPYDYEIGRIINIEPATKNLIQRIRKYSLFQTSSSNGYNMTTPEYQPAKTFNYKLYDELLNKERNVWVADVLITNETAKQIWLNPATSHLLPRYVSPSIIHAPNPKGDYSKVNKFVLDHLGIVDKPIFENGRQIAGAAYGEDAKLRGACFGDTDRCLNVLQTSSTISIKEETSQPKEKCVTCPDQLGKRLSQLFHDTMKKHSYLFQTSSSNISNMSSNDSTQSTSTNESQSQSKATSPLAQLTQQPQTTTPPSTTQHITKEESQTFTIDPNQGKYVPDTKALSDYNEFGKYVSQWILENRNEVKTILDSERPLPDASGIQPQSITESQNVESIPETPGIDTKALLEKLNITEDQLKKMETKEVAQKFSEIKGVMDTILKQSDRTARTLADIKKREEVAIIESMIPKETFTDQRGFNKKEYDGIVGYLHDVKDSKGNPLRKDIITIIGVGLITLKNKQMELSNQQKDLKGDKVPQLFGQTLKTQTPQVTA